MYEEAAENLERAEREFELMTQLLDGGVAQGGSTPGTDTGSGKPGTGTGSPARNSYFDEYYYGGPAAPAAPAPAPCPDGKCIGYSARHGYSNRFGEPSVPAPAPCPAGKKKGPDGKCIGYSKRSSRMLKRNYY